MPDRSTLFGVRTENDCETWLGRDDEQRWHVPAVVAVGILATIAVLIALSIWGEQPGTSGMLGLDIVVGVAGLALLALLPRWPVTGALPLAVLAAVSGAATPTATLAVLHVAQRRPLPIAAAVGAAGVAAHTVRALWRPTEGISVGWWMVLVVAAHAALLAIGALTRARRGLLASLAERARRAENEQARRVAEARKNERHQMAREMHDVLAHRLSLLATHAGAIEYNPSAPPEQLSRAAGVVRVGVHQALDELREVIGVLRTDPAIDDPAATAEAAAEDHATPPQPGLADLPRLLEESRAAGMPVRLEDAVGDSGALPRCPGLAAYRVVQEGLTNARKHACGQPVEVLLDGRPGADLVIDVSNPLAAHTGSVSGSDMGSPSLTPGSGTGLVGLSERVQLAGGRLDHEVTAAGEFRLHARLPWPT